LPPIEAKSFLKKKCIFFKQKELTFLTPSLSPKERVAGGNFVFRKKQVLKKTCSEKRELAQKTELFIAFIFYHGF
jgi:hypothetical protein